MKSEQQISDFVAFLKSRNKSKSTLIAYYKDLGQLAESKAEIPLSKYTSEDIKEFVKTQELKPKTISRKLNSYRTFYKFLVDSGKLQSNPAMEVPHPKIQNSNPRIFSAMEYLALRQVSNSNLRLHTMIELLLQTGIRIGELSRLRVSDVEIKKTKGYLTIIEFSTNPTRRIELSSKAIEVLIHYMDSVVYIKNSHNINTPLFATRDGKPIIIRNIRSSIDRAIDKAGIKNACVNDLRNTFIVHQLLHGVPVEIVTEFVGHKSKATTSRYLEMVDGDYKAKHSAKIVEL